MKVPTALPLTSILKQPLNSGHPATPCNGQFSLSQLYASNTQRPRFSGHSLTFSARLSTITTVVNNLTLDTSGTSLCLAFPAYVQQKKAQKTQPCCTQQPDYAVPRLPEIYRKPLSWGHLARVDKMLVPKGVRYREVPLYVPMNDVF